jgi:hypothetical protein
MVRCNHIVENLKTEALLSLEKPMQVRAAVAGKLEKEVPPVTAMSDVPYVACYEVAMGARHGNAS